MFTENVHVPTRYYDTVDRGFFGHDNYARSADKSVLRARREENPRRPPIRSIRH